MTCIAYVLLGAFGGMLVTVFVWSLCAIAGETDRQMEQEEGNDYDRP